jgi:hypothetical protein
MAKKTGIVVRRFYKSLLLGVLAVVAFMLKFADNNSTPQQIDLSVPQASADFVSPGDGDAGPAPADSDCPSDAGPSDCA